MIRVEAHHIEIRNPRLQRGRAILRMASDRDRGNVGFCIAILRPDLTEDDARMLLDAAPSTATAVATAFAWVGSIALKDCAQSIH